MTRPLNKYKKKKSVQFKIGILMILAVVLLSATSYLLYRNLSSIVSSIRIDVNPELRLMSIRDISADITKAGNSVRIYTITKKPADIKPYYMFISSIDEKVDTLMAICGDDSVLLAQVDTISSLIEENIIIWNKLLVINKADTVIDYLSQLSGQLAESETSRKQGILKRVFSSSSQSLIDEQEIMARLNSIVEQNQTTRDELAARELQLAINSSEITEKFYDLITRMENELHEVIQVKAAAAAEMAGQSYRWLVMLSISGGLLALLVLFIIIRYARNAYAYQIALENSKDEAENLAKTKELFMANMSHEIRTPVTAISGFTEQLLHEVPDEKTADSLKIIKSSSDHLLKIINDILDFSKLQNNKLILEKVHFRISQITDDVCRMFEKEAKQNNTRLTCYLNPCTPQVLFGDPYRLKQLMINLLSNSVKFTKNGSVHFEITGTRKSPDLIDLTMEFSDTGIGIDQSRISAVFEDFTQGEISTTRKYGGTGLGLSIVKKLVELHKGTIDLTSRKNKGTTIVCRIPFGIGDEKQIKSHKTKRLIVPDEIKVKKVLVVDDEEYNRLLFSKIFEKWGIDCRTALNGMEALEILKEEKFDLLFMDMLMPGIDGLKTTRFIREEMKISDSDMPVIFISAARGNEDIQNYGQAGINSFLSKPFTEDMLLSVVLSVTGSQEEPAIIDTVTYDSEKIKNGDKIDLKNLLHLSGGDNQFVKQMLESFVKTTGEGLAEIRDAISKEQMDYAADVAHKIQPPCRHLGATELHTLLSKIENNIRNNSDTGSVSELTENALKEFGVIAGLIDDLILKFN